MGISNPWRKMTKKLKKWKESHISDSSLYNLDFRFLLQFFLAMDWYKRRIRISGDQSTYQRHSWENSSCISRAELTLTKLTCHISHIRCSDVLSIWTDLKCHSWSDNTIQMTHKKQQIILRNHDSVQKIKNIPSSVLTIKLMNTINSVFKN